MKENIEFNVRIPRSFRYIVVFVCAAILFIGGRYVFATTPNPGHPWTDLGNGTWQVANTQTALRSFTFPDSDATVLTTAGAPQSGTVIYGNGTGVLATTSAGTAGFVLALLSGVPTWTATTTLSTITGTLALTSGGTNASLTASNGGIVWSNASQLQILAGNSAANHVLLSGASATPSWSTAAYPSAVGTAGQVLMSNGTNWVSSATSSSGTFIKTQTLTSGTTYTPTSGTKSVFIRMCGGGGGGGGATGATTPTGSVGGGGGGGAYLEKYVTFNTTAASYTIAIGAAGSAGVAANGAGGAGGSTTFACDVNCSTGAVTFTAPGGSGAPAANTAGTSVLASLGGAGGAVATNGDLNAGGQPGGAAQRFSGSTGVSGIGAVSQFGGGGNSVNATAAVATAGNTGIGFCSGGSGAISVGSATGVTGGAGKAGVIVISEYR